MAKTDFKNADEYIATFPAEVQTILQTVRQAIQQAVPKAEEVINYQIPAFKYHGWVLYYSAHTKHFSLACPPPCAGFEAFKTELVPYVRSKSALQIPLDQPVPVELIANMARHQAKWNLENTKPKPKKTK